MSHSQFHCTSAYTWTFMAQPLRQKYDYWQDQTGNYPRGNPAEPFYLGFTYQLLQTF